MNQKLTICLVDDNPEITELLQDHFEFSKIDCESISFNDPSKAMEYLDTHPYTDITITDFHMGKYNGFDIINHSPDEGLTILMSGHITEEEKDLLDPDKVIFFDKPLSMKKLDDVIIEYSQQISA